MIEVTQVSRSLDRKTTILGLELIDIFVLVTFTSVLNLMFGATDLKNYLVYLPSLGLGCVLVISKRGKPDQFLFHFLRFHVRPNHLTCFAQGPLTFIYSKALFIRGKRK
jgi:hypothetical protein